MNVHLKTNESINQPCVLNAMPVGTVVAECECCSEQGIVGRTDKSYVIHDWSKESIFEKCRSYEVKGDAAAITVSPDINANVAAQSLQRRMKKLGVKKGRFVVLYKSVDQYILRERFINSLCNATSKLIGEEADFFYSEMDFLF